MLKKSNKNAPAPLLGENGSGPRAIVTQPNLPGSTKNHVIVTEVSGNGRKGTFTAPRKGDDMNPAACGYTKVK